MAEPTPERLLDPDCRDGKHGSCVGDPCECFCHREQGTLIGGMRMPAPERQDPREQITTPDGLARLFHETYERLAPEHGYKTREASAVPWEDVPAANKSLMVAVAAHVFAVLAGGPGDLPKRMADELRAHAQHGEDPDFCTCGERVHDWDTHLAEAVMPVRSELGAHMAARIAVAERDLEDAKVELASTEGQLGDYRATLKRISEENQKRLGDRDTLLEKYRETVSVLLGQRDELTTERDALKAELAEARAAIERLRADIDKMRHGKDPFGGSAADSADLLDAAVDASQRPEDTREETS